MTVNKKESEFSSSAELAGPDFDIEQDEPPKKPKLSPRAVSVIKIVSPLAVIAVCAVIVFIMINGVISDVSGIAGRYELANTNKLSVVDVKDDMTYTHEDSVGNVESGKWAKDGEYLLFEPNIDIPSYYGKLINNSYLVFEDDKYFLNGEVPTTGTFDGEVASDTVSYGFKSDGSFYEIEDNKYDEIGSYVIDDCFITVTTDDGTVTYLNCGNGITSHYYQVVRQ